MHQYRVEKTVTPVLMYHQVVDQEAFDHGRVNPYVASVADFRSQLQLLRGAGCRTVSLRELLPLSASPSIKNDEGLVVLTFDDGYLDNYLHAYPLLCQLNLKAVFFVIANKIGQSGFMTWEHLREMQAHGMSIQSHTLNHAPLATLDAAALRSELRDSRRKLEDGLQSLVDAVSFPHGSYDARVIEATIDAGYAASCCSDFGYFDASRTPHGIPRIAIRRNDDGKIVQRILAREPKYFARVKLANSARRLAARLVGEKNYQHLYDLFYKGKGSGMSSP